MNTTHSSIWNAALGAWVAVSEITRACGKRSGAVVALVLIGSSVCSSVGAQDVFIDAGASVTVPVSQSSPWNIGGSLLVGDTGTGTLTVSNGGAVSNTGGAYLGIGFGAGAGNVTVTGAGSTWSNQSVLHVGNTRTGTLTVSNGGTVSSATGYLGFDAGAVGNATVTGAGTRWTNGQLRVGNGGNGTLTVSNGGTVSSAGDGYVGFDAGAVGNATVTGANSTWTNSGELLVGRDGQGTLTVSNGGKVSNSFGSIGRFLGAIGNATVTGAGSTWTNSANLTVGISGVGTLTVANAGHVSVNSGTGVLGVAQFAGSGVLNIGAAVGSSAQAAGTVAAGELRFGLGTGSLNFNHTDAAYVFGTRITGPGVLNHYAGTTILTGANTYTGATTVSGGTLRVNGSIANSNVTVNSGGTLGGSGTVGNTSIAAGGMLTPGNSIGTLNVAGNLSFAAGSIYSVEVDAAGNNDRINATGTATINGGTVDVQAAAGTYAVNARYTLLNASGVTGRFDGVSGNLTELAFLTPTLGYDANNVFLTLMRNGTSFSAIAITPNQIATATALQNAVAGAGGDMSTVINAVSSLSAAQARAAYDSASGAGLVALRGAGAGFAAGFGNQLQARLGAVQGGEGGGLVNSFSNRPVLLAANDRVSDLMAPVSDSPQKFSLGGGAASSSSSSSQGRGFWLRSSGGQQNTDSDGNAAASKLRNGALSAGFDAEVGEGLVLGAALSSGTARLAFDTNTGTGKSRGSALAVYGSYAAGPWTFKGSASAARSSNHMDRAVTVGALSRTASSDFDSSTLSAYGEASCSMAMNGWTLQPLAALSVSRHKSEGFTETGAGALNLQVAGQTINSTKSLLGAKASFEAGSVRLEPRVVWAHEFGDLNRPMTAQFQGAAAASPFEVSGVALKRDTLILGLGASGSISQGVDLFADLQAEHNSRQNKLAVLMGVRVRW
ncbi:autotransporter domain-containing protein [Polaromonas sp.]|uniref:autotransporter domain-containing protein n=1 Tax=Polaromonas sp. TaxID=1869339 RepID=UPI003266D1F1